MPQGNNFLSLLFCFYKNGNYVEFPLFQDVSADDIIYARLLSLPNAAGVNIPAFLITAQNPKSLQYDTYWVRCAQFLQTLTQLKTELNALNSGNSFTQYTGLQEIPVPAKALSDYNGGIVINDVNTKSRFFDGDNATFITLNIKTNLIYEQVKVSGDQTSAGIYYYNDYL